MALVENEPSPPVDDTLDRPLVHPTEDITMKPLSLKDLPEGSKPDHVLRCLKLIEHAITCDSGLEKTCSEGEGCRRSKHVFAHHFNCRNMRLVGKDECSICRQLLALLHNHSIRCQVSRATCVVPYCQNNIHQQSLSKLNQFQQFYLGCRRREYQNIIHKLSEAMNYSTREEKLQNIQHIVEANPCTIKILRFLMARKQKLKSNYLIAPMSTLAIRKKQLIYRATVSFIPHKIGA